MLYYHHTRRRLLDRTSYQKGMTGYRGILHELVVEVPTRGTEWLLRKQSVDIHELIPRVITLQTYRQRMISAVEDLAAYHTISLYALEVDGTSKSQSEAMDEGKSPKQHNES